MILVKEDKAELEAEKIELTESLFVATESLRKMKNFITEKYSNLEQNLFKENAKNEGLEKKYKNIIRQMKTNEKRLYQENQNLKNKINESENENNLKEQENKLKEQENKLKGQENKLKDKENNLKEQENNLKIENNNDRKIIINKNLNLFNKKKETNIIIFHKKPSQSPPGNIKKSNITNDNISTKSNIKYVVKINHRNFRTNNDIKISTSENINKNKQNEQIDLKQSER